MAARRGTRPTPRPERITIDDSEVTIVRSDARRKTVSLERVDGAYVMRVPASLADDEIEHLAGRLLERFRLRQRRRDLNGDDALERRARELLRQYLGNDAPLTSIRYVTNQRRRFGSCTPAHGTIRISDAVARLPSWVRDYVIIHELAHLIEPNHGPGFWALVARYPLAERARGYLMALGLEDDVAADDSPA